MNDITLINQLVNWFCDKGYQVINYTDIIKIKYDDSDINVLKEILSKLNDINYKKFIIRCLTKKKLYSITVSLIEEFISATDNDYRWIIGNALYTIADKTHNEDYIKIALNKEYRSSRQMIILLLGKTKNDEIRNVLLSLLSDYDLLPHIIKALKNNINSEAYAQIQAIVSDENKAKVISDLKMLKKSDPDYRNVDVNGYWKLVQREANKTLK
ncbi:MAG: hypothetical protein NC177_16275 [Ruminococcus flavefaciens]|nr:hypothetical protein [Ruminococcus flavefaciens]